MEENYVCGVINELMKNMEDIKGMTSEQIQASKSLFKEQLETNYSPEMKEQYVNTLVQNLENQRLSREEAKLALDSAKETLEDVCKDGMNDEQKELADMMLEPLFSQFEEALSRYHLYSIELPLTLAPGAKVPSYAHDTDACADLYALEDTEVAPHTYGNKIRTGVNIQLPEGWMAMIFPRSSTGAKTTMRLSNSVGIIDSGYRGELGVLFDNTSDNPASIKQGDRIAQLLVMPSYRFQPKVVDILASSDRGEGGFGSTGT